ncbi:MAG TPA: hypothetical protein VF574_15035 [Allosphingosinicella sp.]
MATREPFPVLCDRCQAEGLAGEAEFERLAGLGDLLDFEPVPRRVARADGWTPEIQRAFVAALAVTGSDRQAAHVVERAAFGVSQLRKAKGNESFLAACEKALEIYQERERVRRSDNLLAAAHGEAARTRPRLAWSKAATRRPPAPVGAIDEGEVDEAEAMRWLERMLSLYLIKLESERSARLEGHVAAADLYVRQATAIEVMMDLAGAGCGVNVLEMINNLSVEGVHFIHVAETPFSRLLDDARRRHWEKLGEPARPEPPSHLFEAHHGVALEPGPQAYAGRDPSLEEQWRAFEAQHARDASALVEWEAKARREAAEWRERVREGNGPPPAGEERKAPPGAEGEDPAPEPPPGEEPAP